MGLPWRKIGGALKGLLPFVPLIGGPVGAVLKAISTSVLVIEDVIANQSSATKRQRAIDLVGTMLTIAEDATNRDLLNNETLAIAVGSVIDAEVALRNAHSALEAVMHDLQGSETGN